MLRVRLAVSVLYAESFPCVTGPSESWGALLSAFAHKTLPFGPIFLYQTF